MTKKYWIADNRFKYMGLILLIMWAGFMLFFYLKADEITKDPCSICAKQMGSNVFCTTQSLLPVTRTYYPNGSISDNSKEVKVEAYKEINKNKSEVFGDLNFTDLVPKNV